LIASQKSVKKSSIRYATATQSHVEPPHSKRTRSFVERTVVVGSAMVVAANDAPHVIARAVPLSVSQNSRKSPSFGVPDRLVVIEVIAVARPVKICTSTLSEFVVGVAPGAFVVAVRRVMRLLVRVFVEEIDGITTPSTAITPAAEREMVVSVAPPEPSSIVVRLGLADHAGAVPVPAETSTLPTATAARRVYAVVLDAVRMSPTA